MPTLNKGDDIFVHFDDVDYRYQVSSRRVTRPDDVSGLEQRYDDCLTRPSYVLLLGDSEYVPTFVVNTSGSPTTGSDYQYANDPSFFLDVFPDFGVARMPVDTLTQANTVVDKTIKI